MNNVEDARFNVPLYTPSVAAFHLGMSPSGLRYWINKGDLLTIAKPESKRGPRLPFIALVEAQLYSIFRKEGLSMQAIHAGMRVVRKELGSEMLKKGNLAHNGSDILIRYVKDSADRYWMRAKDYQLGIPKIIDEGLSLIKWASDGYPASLKLAAYKNADVIADPNFAFGQPVIERTRARVIDIVDYFKAGEAPERVAEEMGVPVETVMSIIRLHVAAAA